MNLDAATHPVSGADRKRAVAAATIGSAFEWYDFIVFSFFAGTIVKQYFPATDSSSQLLIGLATFGVGFFMRPLGAIVLGIYGDRRGRRAALTTTIALMMVGVFILTFVPPYSWIGIAGAILILIARLFQGFSAGGEFGGATSFLSEYSLPGRRGLYVSWQQSSQFMASLLGALLGAVLSASLSADALDSYGWRIPFAIGLLIGPVGIYIRRRLDDTPAFKAQGKPAEAPLREALGGHFARVLGGFGLVVMGTVSVYVLVLFLPTYAARTFGMPPTQAFIASAIMSAILVVLCVLAGMLSDRVGRRPVILVSAILLVILVYPLMAFLAAGPTMTRLILVEIVFAILIAGFSSVAPAMMAELFPTRVRNTGLALSYNFAVAIFGGFGQFIVAWLIQATGDVLAPAYYVLAASIVGTVAVLLLPDRTGQALD